MGLTGQQGEAALQASPARAALAGAWRLVAALDPAPLGPPSFLWRSGELAITALGCALELPAGEVLSRAERLGVLFAQPPPAPLPGPWVVALPFLSGAAAPLDGARAAGDGWLGLDQPRAFAPALLHIVSPQLDGRALLVALAPLAGARSREAAEEALARAARLLQPGPRALAATGATGADADPDRTAPAGATGAPGLEHAATAKFAALVARATQAIARGSFEKVVLARSIDVPLPAPLDPQAFTARLARRFPSCRTFWLQGARAAFAGASPELLARIEGSTLACDALAGTAAPGAPLLGNDKDLREHHAVVRGLEAALAPLAERIDHPATPRLIHLANVDHLHTPLSARLRSGVGIDAVVRALHPSAAVAGAPREAALRFIEEHEGLDRGLYAGLVGLVGPERAELHVALRSALITSRRARLFVGAGIVAGSTPEAECAETGLKARALLAVLEGQGGAGGDR